MSIEVVEEKLIESGYIEDLYMEFTEPAQEWADVCLASNPDLPLIVFELLFWSTVPIDSNRDLDIRNADDIKLIALLREEEAALEMNSMKLEASYKEKAEVVHKIAIELESIATKGDMPILNADMFICLN